MSYLRFLSTIFAHLVRLMALTTTQTLSAPLHQIPACPILSPPRVRCARCLSDVSSKPAPRPDRGVVAGQGHAE